MIIFTDGSYTRTTSGLDGLYSLQPTSQAFSSIVFQPRGDRLPGPRTFAIRITQGEIIRGCNAYIMESLALALACKLRFTIRHSHHGALLPIYTDCKSACHHALHPPPHPWTSTAYFLYSLIWATHPTPQDLNWTPGHPERRTTDFSKWTDFECGNNIADLVAAEHPPAALGHLYSLTAQEVLQFLLLDCSWYIADGPLPCLRPHSRSYRKPITGPMYNNATQRVRHEGSPHNGQPLISRVPAYGIRRHKPLTLSVPG